ncbi:uncharacterized protein LOC113907850 isoform X2 [Zalophus californianus]|uniref:Uncharacterized protein LOC113907850 isoform X2 n=1 Tax=Zalophus californianus TaxID=9704 RepID=A0A6J2AZG5_ZALCA|nr:uncharacterized protein LOC113907850 isoform X2 [Zalophus californianus]
MEKQEAPGVAGGLSGESPGGATKGVPGGIGGVEADAGPPSGVVLFHGSGTSLHSGGAVTCCPGSSRPSGGAAVLGSGPNQHPGRVADRSAGSRTYPDGLNASFPGTSVCGTCRSRSGCSGVFNSERSPPRSGSTLLHSHKPCEDRPRSILKTSTSIFMQKSPSAEKKKSQRWDEMNILATYHPAGKDYGSMKVDEPSTPYHRRQDSDEDLLGASSGWTTPQALAERFATMDNFYPKVLQYSDNRSSGSSASFSKTHSSDFDKHRKSHYDEGKFLKAQRNLPFSNNKHSNEASASMGGGSRGVMLDPEPRPVEKGWTGGLARGVKDEIGLVTRNHIPKIKASANFNWVIENPISTEVRLLDHTGSPVQDPRTPEESLAGTTSQPGAALFSKDRAQSGWCQWLVSKGLNWRSPESSEKKPGSSPHSPHQNQCRREPRQGRVASCAGQGGRGPEWTKPCGFDGHKRREADNGKCSQPGMGWGPASPSPHHPRGGQ